MLRRALTNIDELQTLQNYINLNIARIIFSKFMMIRQVFHAKKSEQNNMFKINVRTFWSEI